MGYGRVASHNRFDPRVSNGQVAVLPPAMTGRVFYVGGDGLSQMVKSQSDKTGMVARVEKNSRETRTKTGLSLKVVLKV